MVRHPYPPWNLLERPMHLLGSFSNTWLRWQNINAGVMMQGQALPTLAVEVGENSLAGLHISEQNGTQVMAHKCFHEAKFLSNFFCSNATKGRDDTYSIFNTCIPYIASLYTAMCMYYISFLIRRWYTFSAVQIKKGLTMTFLAKVIFNAFEQNPL